jgi:hypothetical protein
MMCAGRMRFRASLVAMRRTSWIDQRINDGVAMLLFLRWFGVAFFWQNRIGAMADHRHHGESEHDHRNVAMPAMRGSALNNAIPTGRGAEMKERRAWLGILKNCFAFVS